MEAKKSDDSIIRDIETMLNLLVYPFSWAFIRQ